MPGPALARNIGAEEMEYSSTWSDRIQVYADAKKYDVLRRIHNAIIVEIRSILWCRCRHVWQVTVGTSRSTRKDDIVLMGGCGYFGGNYKEQHPGAALPAPSLPRPGQCGGVWWWREQWTWRWRRWRPASSSTWSSWYKCILSTVSTHSKSGSGTVLMG